MFFSVARTNGCLACRHWIHRSAHVFIQLMRVSEVLQKILWTVDCLYEQGQLISVCGCMCWSDGILSVCNGQELPFMTVSCWDKTCKISKEAYASSEDSVDTVLHYSQSFLGFKAILKTNSMGCNKTQLIWVFHGCICLFVSFALCCASLK